jgi:glucoamylase
MALNQLKYDQLETGSVYPITASYAISSSTGSGGGTSLITGSTYSITSSWSNNSISSSYSLNSSTASYLDPISQSLIPSTGSIYSLGSPTNKWKDLYVSTGSIYIGETVLSTSGSTLFANSSPIVTLNTASGQIEVAGLTASLSASFASNAILLNNTASTVFATTGSNTFSGSQIVHGNITVNGSLFGTASVALVALTSSYNLNSVSSSYSLTSSYAMNGGSGGGGTTLTTGSSYPITSSWAINVVSASYALIAESATTANSSTSASYALTASFALNSIAGASGSEGGGLLVATSDGFNYNIAGYSGTFPTITLVRGQLYYFNISGISASHPFALRLSSGNTSAVPGTTNNDPVSGNANTSTLIIYRVPNDAPNSIVYQCTVHSSMIGTINIVNQYGTTLTTGSSYPITSSWATNAITATSATSATSANSATSASYSLTSSYNLNSISSSFASTASYVVNSVSSSYALTASYALNAGSGGGSSTSSLIGQTFVPTASVSQLSLTQSVSDNDQILVILDGLVQSRTGSYTVSGSTLTLTENADSGSNIDVRFLGGSSSGGSTVSSSYALTSSFSTTSAPRTAIYRYGTTSIVNPGGYADTIIKYDTAVSDSTSWYDNSNGRFTPNVAGWYMVCGSARVYGGSSSSEGYLGLFKNGNRIVSNGGVGFVQGSISFLVYFNGTTDYIQFYSNTSAAITNSASSSATSFSMVYMTP